MRNMRFRAYDKSQKKMIYKFTLGSVTDINDDLWTCPTSLREKSSTLIQNGEASMVTTVIDWYNNDQLEIMEYSDIQNFEDEYVCEGDIVEFSYGIPPVRVRAEVVLRGGAFEVLTPGHNPESVLLRDLEMYVGEFYIIGNIYENEDLV